MNGKSMYTRQAASVITADTRSEIANDDFFSADIVIVAGWVLKNRYGYTHRTEVPFHS